MKKKLILLLFLLTQSYCTLYNHSSHPSAHFVFAHGFGGAGRESLYYIHAGLIPDSKTYPEEIVGKATVHDFDFPSASGGKCSLGQWCEMEALKEKIECLDEDVVLFGFSMGAATVLNYGGSYSDSRIKAIVAQAPFDSVDTIIKAKSRWIPRSLGRLGVKILVAPEFNSHGPHPLSSITCIPHHIPVLLIHSRKDALIPLKASQNLYSALRATGHPHVYLIEVTHGGHTEYDYQSYRAIVQAFYKKYHLPYIESLAQEGEIELKKCQPLPYSFKERDKKRKK